MDFKRIVLIAAAAGTVTLTGCAAQSEYYGVFVEERDYSSDIVEDTAVHINFYPEITSEATETSDAVSTPKPSVTSASESSESSATPSTSPVTPPQTSPEPQTTPKPQTTPAPQTTASTPKTAAPSTTPSAPAPKTTPSTPAAQTTPPTTPTHAPSTNPINPATSPETPASSKKPETTTATVAAAVDDPAPAESYITEVLSLVNAERAKEGLSPLVLDSELSKAAKVRAEEQTVLFGHTRPDGQSCFSVFKERGIGYSTAGENTAAGYSTPEEVVEAWMSSDGHRANILKPCFEKLGVGFVYSDDSYGAYWVQLFIEE